MLPQKNDAPNRRYSNYRSNNKRQCPRQPNGSGILNSSKNAGHSKDGNVHPAEEPSGDRYVLQQTMRSGRLTPSGVNGFNSTMQPYIQIAPQQYPQYIPYCPIEATDPMYVPYMFPQLPGE